ncbi:alpha/beta hydrolase [Streptomyces gibsoniae]|uniref:Alpha/beta hydrolase n=1 Tax=Streptomyces gibsoniae TaxID=3075529 RepID=A0ABU2TVD7_9ACTN|nr:alpha/beta hydrolase [Streptomyces sp. DSM 41699]MDT0464933.1 alpha/beta hydrolase [Streptomyces sp. DSM 41699]
MRGDRPLLLISESGEGDADRSTDLIDHLVDAYTVVTYDRRGLSRSLLDAPERGATLAEHADDVHRLLAPLTDTPALMLGCSLGAVIGLHLAVRHPEQISALIAHEPVAPRLLPADERTRHEHELAELQDLYRPEGPASTIQRWQTLRLRSDRAQTLSFLGRHAECEAECAAVARAAAQGREPETVAVEAAARNGQIYALNAQGRHAEAEALARDALAPRGVRDRITLALRLGLARSLNGQARYEEALAEAKQIGRLRRIMPEEHRHPETGAVELAVATALLGLGRATEARTEAAAAHTACLGAFGPGHHRTAEARALLDRIDGA